MYSETDLESAVAAGKLSPEAAVALRDHVSGLRATPMVDEENFRLITGFNDIFVAIAGVLLLVGAAWIGSEFHAALGGIFVAVLSWGLAEYFTKLRRMALPSIIFLLAFIGGVFAASVGILIGEDGNVGEGDRVGALLISASAAITVAAAYAHWRRFYVPITIAAGIAALAGVVVALLLAVAPGIEIAMNLIVLIVGLGVFGFAMRWDMQDPARTTRKSDVAFWLHLLAAPLIAHPIFTTLGLFKGDASVVTALIVVALYIAMGIIALAVDRRALLVSALAYVIAAIISLFREFGAVSLNVALAVFVIGSALLLLSAFWQDARRMVVGLLPEGVRQRLPHLGTFALNPQPAS
jgi:hypothetical protein